MFKPAAAALALGLYVAIPVAHAGAADEAMQSEARRALLAAGGFFRDHLGVDGTYVWQYSPNGAVRRGERGVVSPTIGWVQPPGTPAVGAAFLRIYDTTSDKAWLDAAHQVADALTSTQLLSGGWFYLIETNPRDRQSWCYRGEIAGKAACGRIVDKPDRNETVLDDNNTQSVMNFLMWFDTASGHSDPKVEHAIRYGLKRLIDVQYPNGALPVFFGGRQPGAGVEAASAASLPDGWSRDWVKPQTPPYFIVNDNLPRDSGRLFLNAYRLFGRPAYREAAIRIGEFLLSAQLPPPQQGWAQQYDRTMQPVWGRIFEPPAVASRESAGCIDFLIDLFAETGDRRYLDAANSAAIWLKASRFADGLWSRYYEIHTNRPLYVDNDNHVTFETKNLIDHYGMSGRFDIPQVLDRLANATSGAPVTSSALWINGADALSRADLVDRVKSLIDGQDAYGRWLKDGWIDGATFVDGVFALSRFLGERTETDATR